MEILNQTLIPNQYNKISGWLYLVAVGLVLAPLRLAYMILLSSSPLVGDTWLFLTTRGSVLYHQLWAPVIIFELVFSVIFFIYSIILVVYFFRKKRIFPKMMIILLVVNLLYSIVDYLISGLIPAVAATRNNIEIMEAVSQIILTAIACFIWVTYFFKSKRVKGTFVS